MSEASSGLKFLVVDDTALGRSVLSAMLSQFGRVDTAEGAKAALRLYSDAAASCDMYDLLLLDIIMPEIDGITLLKELRKFESAKGLSATAAVMTTAADQREHVQAAVQAGAAGYLIKPLGVEKITGLLKRLELIAA